MEGLVNECIKDYLPHRNPMLLIERVLHHIPSHTIQCKAFSSCQNWLLKDQDISNKFYPVSLLIEMGLQASMLLPQSKSHKFSGHGVVAKLDKFNMKKPVKFGQALFISAKVIINALNMMKFHINIQNEHKEEILCGEVICVLKNNENIPEY